jgi:hypothetical protein
MEFNATFNNISVTSWPSVLLVEETGVSRENHRPVASHWQTWSHNVAWRCFIVVTLVMIDTDCTGSLIVVNSTFIRIRPQWHLNLGVRRPSVVRRPSSVVRPLTFHILIYSSETTGPNGTKLGRKHLYHNNKIIVPKELKLKNIQKEIRKPTTPKCQFKWDTIYEKKFNWILIYCFPVSTFIIFYIISCFPNYPF